MKHKELFESLTYDILRHPLFLSQRMYRHHRGNLYDHVIAVAYRSFVLAKALRLDYRAVARAALLHDFFLYDWRIDGKEKQKRFFKKHGFQHPKIALKNAKKHFELSKLERDIIVKHMFPLTPTPPRYKESLLVSLVDKYFGIAEWVTKPMLKHHFVEVNK